MCAAAASALARFAHAACTDANFAPTIDRHLSQGRLSHGSIGRGSIAEEGFLLGWCEQDG